jgi:hypothetical protein
MLRTLQRSSVMVVGRRGLATTDQILPRITEKRLEEQGPGGRSSVSGQRVAIFGATGFLGKHVCNALGKLSVVLGALQVSGSRLIQNVSIFFLFFN